ncbi:cell division regulator GpsB [Streptococcus plurextorum]|uniref:cell division regulator GpsB n=1 Tax=Streptococcus plurextorum TaxID=456876 RepID=UPI00040B8B88|nr:cell division regulator GpsB [Streptococcus plurextorum]
MAKIILSPKEICEREFKQVLRGYDKDEVDEFLDEVIKDYETFAAQVQALRKENEELREKLAAQPPKPTGQTLPNQERIVPSQTLTEFSNPNDLTRLSTTVSNFDILKRISRLEREVFGKQISE